MTVLIQTAGAFFTSLTFAVVLQAPKKFLAVCGLSGAAGWLVYILAKPLAEIVIAAFLSTMAVALVSHIFARVKKAPVTVFLIPGLLPIVPGASIYRSVYCMIGNQPGLSEFYLTETLQIAGAIAIGVFVVDSLFRHVKKL